MIETSKPETRFFWMRPFDRRALLTQSVVFGFAAAGLTTGAEAAPSEPQLTPDVVDVPYVDGGTPEQVLDIYLPTKVVDGRIPVIVWIHGGGWTGGDKSGARVPYLVDDGYALISINYRLLQNAMFPAQIVDANAALSWVWNHADAYGFDRERIVVAGGSAGGRSASIVATSANNGIEMFQSDPNVKIAALIDCFGGTESESHFEGRPQRKEGVESQLTQEEIDAMLPMTDPRMFLDADDPPTLIMHGDQDTTVPIAEGEALSAAMEAAGISVTFARMEGYGHETQVFRGEEGQAIVRRFLLETLAQP